MHHTTRAHTKEEAFESAIYTRCLIGRRARRLDLREAPYGEAAAEMRLMTLFYGVRRIVDGSGRRTAPHASRFEPKQLEMLSLFL